MTKIKTRVAAIIVLISLLVSSLIIGGVTVSNIKQENAERKILFEYNSGGAIAVCDDVEDLPSDAFLEETEYSMQILFNYEPYSDAVYEKNHEGKETFVEYSKKYHTEKNQAYLSEIDTENYDIIMSEYTPYIFLNRIDEGTVDDVYIDALDIAKNDNVGVVRICTSSIYDVDFLEEMEEFSDKTYDENEEVQELFSNIEESMATDSSDLRSSAYENFPTGTPYTGNGIKIGLLDTGEFNTSHSNFSDITAEVVYDNYTTTSSDDDPNHPTKVASVLGGKYGYASDASIYYVDVNSDKGYAGIELLIDRGCQIVNISIGKHEIVDSAYDTGLEGYFDYIYLSTKVIMVAATSNDLNKSGRAGYVTFPALCANVISVGSVTDDAIPDPSAFSSYKTKNGIYSDPNLVAVGTARNVGNFGLRNGTSYSAPAVTGAIALYFERYGVQELPEMLAVLSATANRNVYTGSLDGHTNNLKTNGSRERTGAGVLDVELLLDCDTFLCSNQMTFTSRDYVTIGNVYIAAGRTAQIALAWERAATRTVEGALWWQTETYSSDPLADFELYLFSDNGSTVGLGWSSSSNVEIVEYTATTSGFYTIKIKPDSNYANTHNINCVIVVK